MKSRHHFDRTSRVLEAIHIASRLMVFWSVFLGMLELVTLFAATKPMSRDLDLCALSLTIVLFAMGTWGVKIALRIVAQPSDVPDPITRASLNGGVRG